MALLADALLSDERRNRLLGGLLNDLAHSGRVPTERETSPLPQTAAFFDLDNTLLHGASMYFIGRGLHRHGVVSTGEVLRTAWQQLVFRLVGERHGHVSSVRDRSLAFGTGVKVGPLIALAEKIYDESIADRILDETLALARTHLDRGQDVIIVTAAPIELAQIVAGRLGLTDALGTVSEVEDGRWTGRLASAFLHGPAKADAIRGLAAERGYDLARCSAYTDSINDLPMLQCVGEPHAVNPDRRLRALAAERHWPIHDFRVVARRVMATVVGGCLVVGAVLGAVTVHRLRRPLLT